MTTEKQIIANRENAKLGGVNTERGKAIVRSNAITHGLLTKNMDLLSESRSEPKKTVGKSDK
jgi:hypothetical protein